MLLVPKYSPVFWNSNTRLTSICNLLSDFEVQQQRDFDANTRLWQCPDLDWRNLKITYRDARYISAGFWSKTKHCQQRFKRRAFVMKIMIYCIIFFRCAENFSIPCYEQDSRDGPEKFENAGWVVTCKPLYSKDLSTHSQIPSFLFIIRFCSVKYIAQK